MIILISFWSICLSITAVLMALSFRHERRVLDIRERMYRRLDSANDTLVLTAENGDILIVDDNGVHKYTKADFVNRKNRVVFEEELGLRLGDKVVTNIKHMPKLSDERKLYDVSLKDTRCVFLYEDELLEQLRRDGKSLTPEQLEEVIKSYEVEK